jgi:phosphatidylglycerol---prolipoprotein diacylglyceryl transferase
MHPALFQLFDVALPSYFVLLLEGFLFATALGALWARRIGQDPDVIVNLGISMLIFGVLGARLLHVFADGYLADYIHLCTDPSQVAWPISERECERVFQPDALSELLGARAQALGSYDAVRRVCVPLERDCWAWARFWAGGLTFYGGLLGASVAAIFSLRRDRFPFWKAADMAGMTIPVGLAFGRLGCLLGGCCFGSPTGGPLALVFPPNSPASVAQARVHLLASEHLHSLPVHPTQLYESAGCLALGAALFLWLHGNKRYDGQVFVAFLAGYASLRFGLEFLRADDRGGVAGLSTSQWIGVGALGLGWVLHRALGNRRGAQEGRPPASPLVS